jgi:hypothetical protein
MDVWTESLCVQCISILFCKRLKYLYPVRGFIWKVSQAYLIIKLQNIQLVIKTLIFEPKILRHLQTNVG